jgi:hypothetical protein
MNVNIDVKYEQLEEILKQLSFNELNKIKEVIEFLTKEKTSFKSKEQLKGLLLKGPTFKTETIDAIQEARNRISKWRKK